MGNTHTREEERILIRLPTRLWLDESHQGRNIVLEGFAVTRDLAIGGVFLSSSYLLPVGSPLNLELSIGEGELLAARGKIVHTHPEGGSHEPGMGISFTEVDAENRERLLRFFVSDRIRAFYEERFLLEFPRLADRLSLKDVALVINLWEDREQQQLTSLGRPAADQVRRTARGEEPPAPTPAPKSSASRQR